MRFSGFVLALAVVLAVVGSGSIECSPAKQALMAHQGAQLYGRMCSVCHGMNGEGYRADRAPAIGHTDYLATVTDEYLHHAIVDGRVATTMSAWGLEHGGPLRPREVDAIIAYMRTWQDERAYDLDQRPVTGDAAHGATVYASECAKCHGARGTGGDYVAFGGPQVLKTATNGFFRYAIHHGRAGTPMPAFDRTLDDKSIEDVIALARDTWSKSLPLTAAVASPARPPPIPLGPVPLNPHGPDPSGFATQPQTTKAEIIKRELDRGAKMAILDARAPSDYTREHIAGAVSVPFYDPDPYYKDLPKDAWLVCYCACPHAESGQLASKLVANGFKKVTVLDEGLGFWRNKGFPTKSGLDP